MNDPHDLLGSAVSRAGAVSTTITPQAPAAREQARRKDAGTLDRAIDRTRDWLLARQHADGHWCGELEGDTILESEYILLLAWLGREQSAIARRAAQYILQQQRDDGGWALYPGGEVEISGSVKAYFALKLTGHDIDSEPMQRAQRAILAHGGADAVNSFTRFYLALLGQISYDHCPAVPPEAVLLPSWFPISMYKISAWSRTILVPLAIMWAHQPARKLEPALGIDELFIKRPEEWPPLLSPGVKRSQGFFTWVRFFRTVDKTLKLLERWRLRPLRRRALRAAERWMLERFENSDGLGAIFPPIIWSVIALRCLGYDEESVEVQSCLRELDALQLDDTTDDGALRLQPCKSPVWDTAITLRALSATGMRLGDEPVDRTVRWLLDKEVRRAGDWSVNVKAEPGGWFFEYRNEFYPDIDDTTMVMMALSECGRDAGTQLDGETERRRDGGKEEANVERPTSNVQRRTKEELPPERVAQFKADNRAAAHRSIAALDESFHPDQHNQTDDDTTSSCVRCSTLDVGRSTFNSSLHRATAWTLAMQNTDGGWGAFDKDNDSEFLCHVPFADHNAMIDPSWPDISARTLEALATQGQKLGDPAVDRAIVYLRRHQEEDGAWFGRWGVNYIYGTWQVLVGMRAVGIAVDDPAIRRGAAWFVRHQQPCGGWGESADSYADPTLRGQGPVTASQTAWALLGLLAAGLSDHPAVVRGIRYLIETQQEDGSWSETEFTGTGFPLVFYLRYHLYPIYFPLLALSQWRRA